MQTVHPSYNEERVLGIISKDNLKHFELFKAEIPKVFARIDLIAPRDLDHLAEIVTRSHRTHKLVMAIGGDGILNRVLAQLDIETQELALLPSGSGNDMARSLGFPRDLRQKIRHLSTLACKPTDFGTINQIRFHNSAGYGLDTHNLKTREKARSAFGRNYHVAFLTSLLSLKSFHANVNTMDFTDEGRYYWVLAMNSPFVGGGTRIAPHARLDNGKLDLVMVRDTSKLNLVRYLPAAIKGKHIGLPLTVNKQFESLEVELSEPADYLEVDGELYFAGTRKIEIKVHPGSLRMLR